LFSQNHVKFAAIMG